MRLLYVIDSLNPGGAETSLASMASGLVSKGLEMHVLPLSQSRLTLAPQLEASGVEVHHRTRPHGRRGNVEAVVDVARDIQPDLIHTTLYEADIAGRVAAMLRRIPASTSIVSDSYSTSHYRESNTVKLHAARALDSVTGLSAVRFHAITEAIARQVGPRLGIRRSKIDVIPRGRDPLAFPYRAAAARRRIRQELRLGDDARVLLAIGRHEPQKGLQHLLGAVPHVAAQHPGLVVLLAGKEGRTTHALQSLAAQTGVDVRFLGHRTDIADLLTAADVFCFPSEREGFGGVLVEAMAVGCPVVASAIPTSVEVLAGATDHPVGLLAPVGEVSGLVEALDRVLTDRVASDERARLGRERFERLYTIDAVVGQMIGFFERAVLEGTASGKRQRQV